MHKKDAQGMHNKRAVSWLVLPCGLLLVLLAQLLLTTQLLQLLLLLLLTAVAGTAGAGAADHSTSHLPAGSRGSVPDYTYIRGTRIAIGTLAFALSAAASTSHLMHHYASLCILLMHPYASFSCILMHPYASLCILLMHPYAWTLMHPSYASGVG